MAKEVYMVSLETGHSEYLDCHGFVDGISGKCASYKFSIKRDSLGQEVLIHDLFAEKEYKAFLRGCKNLQVTELTRTSPNKCECPWYSAEEKK